MSVPLLPYQSWNLAPRMGLPVMLSTFWMVRVGFVVLEIDGVVPVGIEGDQLGAPHP